MLENWLNSDSFLDGTSQTNGDFLRAFIENLYKAIVNLLAKLGEWPLF